MYYEFYGLLRPPFNLTPDPQFLFLSSRHREALASLEYGVASRKGFTVLTGEIGAGKTTLCRTLIRQLGPNTKVALILNSYLSDLELLQAVNDEFGVPSDSASKKDLIAALNVFLLSENAAGRDCLLIVDEAQNLAPETLEQTRMLSNLETETDKLIQILLMGQPELRDTLRLPRLEQLNQRVTVRHHLSALDRSETADYIQHRLSVAGPEPKVKFADDALDRVYRFSRGVPRKINLVADRALLAGYASEARVITGALADKAIEEVAGQTGSEPAEFEPVGRNGSSSGGYSAGMDGNGASPAAAVAAPMSAVMAASIAASAAGSQSGGFYPSAYQPQPYFATPAYAMPAVYPPQMMASPAIPEARPSALRDALVGLVIMVMVALVGGGSVLGVMYAQGWRPSDLTKEGGFFSRGASAKSASENGEASSQKPSATATPAPTPAPAPTPIPTPEPTPKPWALDASGMPRVERPEHAFVAAQLGLAYRYFGGLTDQKMEDIASIFAKMPSQEVASKFGSIAERTSFPYRSRGLKEISFSRDDKPLAELVALNHPLILELDPDVLEGSETQLSPFALLAPGQNPKGLKLQVDDPVHGSRRLPREDVEKAYLAARVFFFDSNDLTSLKLGVKETRVSLLQTRLSNAGVWPAHGDPPSGAFGLDTRTAIETLQKRHGLPETGELDAATVFFVLPSEERLGAPARETASPTPAPAATPELPFAIVMTDPSSRKASAAEAAPQPQTTPQPVAAPQPTPLPQPMASPQPTATPKPALINGGKGPEIIYLKDTGAAPSLTRPEPANALPLTPGAPAPASSAPAAGNPVPGDQPSSPQTSADASASQPASEPKPTAIPSSLAPSPAPEKTPALASETSATPPAGDAQPATQPAAQEPAPSGE
jgi:general secretion pathway protein A